MTNSFDRYPYLKHSTAGNFDRPIITAPAVAADELTEEQLSEAGGIWVRSIGTGNGPDFAAMRAALAQQEGHVVVTWNEEHTQILAVTRQDDEDRILKVITKAPAIKEINNA